MRILLRSKIYNIKVTDAVQKYEGSITIDAGLMEAANIAEYEQVHVLDVTNSKRFVTYALKGKEGEVCVNGAAALLVNIGDDLIVLAYEIADTSSRLDIIDGQKFRSTNA